VSPVVGAVLGLLALLLSLAAIVLATIANRRWAARPRRSGADPAPSVLTDDAAVDHLRTLQAHLDALTGEVDALRGEVTAAVGSAGAAAELAGAAAAREVRDGTALRHVALVRYDAFADVGGRLSHSVAILDDTRSGLVLTTLAGKADVRTYVRAVSSGVGEVPLSAEEEQAVAAATAGPGRGAAAASADPVRTGPSGPDSTPDPGPPAVVTTLTDGSRP
jgi:hypothetical protein